MHCCRWSHWDGVAKVVRLTAAVGLRPSQTRKATLREATKSTTQVQSIWLFAHDKTSRWQNIHQGGDCEICVEYLFVLIGVIVNLYYN